MIRRFLFAYSADGITAHTKFYFVWLSDGTKDRDLITRMSEYARVNTHYLFVPYSDVWAEFLLKVYDGSSLNCVWSLSYPRTQSISATFFRRWARGSVTIPDIPSINLK